jgi:PHD/YefM family antitoxin component YafN of YafNO toxin-antitoxin module
MQKALSDLASLPETELVRIFDREPLLVTSNGEPRFVAQSLESFEAMIRRLRQLEAERPVPHERGKLTLLRPRGRQPHPSID